MTDAAVDIRLVSKMSQLKEGAQGQGKTFFFKKKCITSYAEQCLAALPQNYSAPFLFRNII